MRLSSRSVDLGIGEFHDTETLLIKWFVPPPCLVQALCCRVKIGHEAPEGDEPQTWEPCPGVTAGPPPSALVPAGPGPSSTASPMSQSAF